MGRRQAKRQHRRHLGPEPPVAFDGAALDPAHGKPDQGQGQLVGQQFVVGKPLADRCHGVESRLVLGFVGEQKRVAPSFPFVLCQIGGVDPFWQLRQSVERGADGLAQDLERQPRGQRIDRLDGLQAGDLVGRADVVGVGDLDFLGEGFDLAADHPDLALGERLPEVIFVSVEEHQGDGAGVVGAVDLVGKPLIGRFFVAFHGQRHGGDGAGLGVLDLGRVTAVDDRRRQVPAEVDQVGPGGLFYQLRNPRPDAGQRRHRLEQGE